MSSTVSVGSIEVTSSHETAESMVTSLSPAKDDAPKPKILRDAGNEVEDAPEQTEEQKAASLLGKKGAEARKAKEAEKEDDDSEAEELAEAERLEKEGKLGKPRHDAKARMLQQSRAAKAAKEAEAKAKEEVATLKAAKEAAEQRLAERERTAKAPEPKEPKPNATDSDDAPKLDDYDSYEKFVRASARYEARQELAEQEKKGAQEFHEKKRWEAIGKVEKGFYELVSKAAKEDPAFANKTVELAKVMRATWHLDPNEPVRTSHLIVDEIFSSEHAPALLLHFSEHPDEFQRLTLLHPQQMVREVGRIEGRFSAAPTATAPRNEISKANPPVRPVAGSPHTADSEPGEDAPLSVFVARDSLRRAREAR